MRLRALHVDDLSARSPQILEVEAIGAQGPVVDREAG